MTETDREEGGKEGEKVKGSVNRGCPFPGCSLFGTTSFFFTVQMTSLILR